jgi:hypothetical protein
MDGTGPAESPAAEPSAETAAAAPLAGDVLDAEGKVEWSPARPDAESGVYHEGEYPHNHRLRAEALSAAGKAEDPDGIVDADAGERLAAQAKADEEAEAARLAAFPPIRANMRTEDLERIAAESDPPIDLTTARNNADRVRLIEAARASNPAAPPPAENQDEEA